MANARNVVRWTGVAFIVAGVCASVLGPLWINNWAYVPLSSPWWSTTFNLFWGGIAALIVGVGGLFSGQYLMEEEVEVPLHEEKRKKIEIPA
jgi:hypothetical protein